MEGPAPKISVTLNKCHGTTITTDLSEGGSLSTSIHKLPMDVLIAGVVVLR